MSQPSDNDVSLHSQSQSGPAEHLSGQSNSASAAVANLAGVEQTAASESPVPDIRIKREDEAEAEGDEEDAVVPPPIGVDYNTIDLFSAA